MHLIPLALTVVLVACGSAHSADEHNFVDGLARRHVDLVIALGRHDAFTATSFFGPPAWRDAVPKTPIGEIVAHAEVLHTELRGAARSLAGEEAQARVARLIDEVEAFKATAHFITGGSMPLEEEARRVYGMSIAPVPQTEITAYRSQIDATLAGPGPLTARYGAYAKRITVPAERLEMVVRLAVEECRQRTLSHIALPEDGGAVISVEESDIAAEIQYAGSFKSKLVFKRRPVSANRLLQLACHEGYPGHHLYAVMRERRAVADDRPEDFLWPSRGVDISEGSADYAVRVTFQAQEEERFMRETLLPAAGLDPSAAEVLAKVSRPDWELKMRVAYEGARRMLAGEATLDAAGRWMVEAGLFDPAVAASWLGFAKSAGAGALTYYPGHERARRAVEAAGLNPTRRWQAYLAFIATP